MKSIKVKEIMTCKPDIISPDDTVKEAARHMQKINCGVLPVGTKDKPIGMITDRDITVRVTAEGKDPAQTKIKDVMTKKVCTCDENDDIETAAEAMRKHDVARLVVTHDNKVTGIVTMVELLRNTGDLAKGDEVLHELVGEGKKRAVGGCCA